MGYVAAAFGNHEFDFGRVQFLKNRETARMAYLGANMKVVDPAIEGMQLPKFVTVTRRGVKIANVAVATDTTPTTAMPSRFVGVEFLPEEPALDDAIRAAWATHPDAVVAIAHECPDKLAPILERHPEWHLAFFGGAHCHKVMARVIGGVSLMSPGWRFQDYVRVPMVIDPRRPEKERVVSARAEIVETAGAPNDPTIPPDHTLQAMLTDDNAKMEATRSAKRSATAAPGSPKTRSRSRSGSRTRGATRPRPTSRSSTPAASAKASRRDRSPRRSSGA